jgi:uncharacterized cupredoxin-like copper-binding protein
MNSKTAITLFMLVAGAVLLPASLTNADGNPVRNPGEIVKKADWKTIETVRVTMGEMFYDPDELVFKAGQPYKLELVNLGKKKHYYTARHFYKAIATRKVQSNKDGEVKAPYFLALEIMPDGGQLDLYFVPVKKGTYPVYCTIDTHREEGSEGTITIE